MKLEGSLDAFSLPDILQLLAFTRKTGSLVLRRDSSLGVVRVHAGEVCAASADSRHRALDVRLIGAGLADDETLEESVSRVVDDPSVGLAEVLVASGRVDRSAVSSVAADQITEALGELLRWPDGDFEFKVSDETTDPVVSVSVESAVAEARQRLESWPELAAHVPSLDVVLVPELHQADDVTCTRDEWGLISLADGRRSVREMVAVLGRGEYAVVRGLASLVERGLLVLADSDRPSMAAFLRRQRMLELLGAPVTSPAAPATAEAAAPPSSPVAEPQRESASSELAELAAAAVASLSGSSTPAGVDIPAQSVSYESTSMEAAHSVGSAHQSHSGSTGMSGAASRGSVAGNVVGDVVGGQHRDRADDRSGPGRAAGERRRRGAHPQLAPQAHRRREGAVDPWQHVE